jgi:hypothetical protein
MLVVRKLHRVIGLLLLLPFMGWILTGFVFFLKPGYSGAYELLQPRTYPLAEAVTLRPAPGWLEFRYCQTVLGPHLLVRTVQGWQQLDPATWAVRPLPPPAEVERLVADALAQNPARYGQITAVTDSTVSTSTGVQIGLNWPRLSLQQTGTDTRLIDRLYKIHYLQWTGVKAVDTVLGGAGLVLVLALSLLGLRLACKPKPKVP